MKVEDLRRYNYLDYYGQSVVVLEILRNDYIVFGYFLDSTLSHFTGSATEKRKLTEKHSPKPIPLNEEWHNKFGIEKDGFNSFRYELPRNNNMKIVVIFQGDYVFLRQGQTDNKNISDDVISIWNTDLSKRDMYVHEWQNLYYALTNKELTIKELVK